MPHKREYKTCTLHKCMDKHFNLEKENVGDTININVAMCFKNMSSRGANENKHLYPHTTKVNRPSPLQTPIKTFARTTELTSQHVLTRTPSHTLS